MQSTVTHIGSLERAPSKIQEQRTAKTQEQRTAAAKAAIRVAALELFALQGYDSTTLSQISARANFSRGLAQYHFKVKEALAEELLDDAVAWQIRYHGLHQSVETEQMNVLQQLQYQVQQVSELMSALLSGEKALQYRGQVLLISIATISSDERLRHKIQYSNSVVGGKISAAIKHGIELGVVQADVDPDGAAAFYIGSNWGLLNEFCVEPKHHQRVLKGFKTLMRAVQSWGNS